MNERPIWCHLLFYFTYYVLNKFRTLIYPSSGACDCVHELPHPSSCSQFVVYWSFCCGWCLVVFVLQAEAQLFCPWSQSITDSGQNQLKYTYQLQQGDKTHHTKHTTTHRKVTLMLKTSVFTEQDDRCGNSSTQSQAPEDGYTRINVRNMLSA